MKNKIKPDRTKVMLLSDQVFIFKSAERTFLRGGWRGDSTSAQLQWRRCIGIRTYETATRNTIDISAVPLLKVSVK